MKTCTMNNAKKAMDEIAVDQIDNVSGGYIYHNEETGKYEVINDKTWETIVSVKDKDTAWKYCVSCGFSPANASKFVVDNCRAQKNKAAGSAEA